MPFMNSLTCYRNKKHNKTLQLVYFKCRHLDRYFLTSSVVTVFLIRADQTVIKKCYVFNLTLSLNTYNF